MYLNSGNINVHVLKVKDSRYSKPNGFQVDSTELKVFMIIYYSQPNKRTNKGDSSKHPRKKAK